MMVEQRMKSNYSYLRKYIRLVPSEIIHKTKTIIISDGMADFNITQNTHTQLI